MVEEYFLGVDIGGTEAKIGLVTIGGEIKYKKSVPVAFDGYETPILTTVNKELGNFIKEAAAEPSSIKAIGVSATGAIDSRLGIVAGSGGHIKNWLGSKIKDTLESTYKKPVFVLNDANAAALGEMWKGAAAGKRNVVVITVGTGVGGGIIVDGKVLLGRSGFAGEIGYILPPFKVENPLGRGCFEDYASTSALVRMVEAAAKEGKVNQKYSSEVTGKVIFEAVKDNDTKVESIVDEWIGNIAAGISGLIHIFNPEAVLIGGGVSAQKELFIDKLRDRIMDMIMEEFKEGLEIKATELKNDAGMIGAVKFCIDNL